MMITALRIISASEIAKVKPDFNYQWPIDDPHGFQDFLYELGMDKSQMYEVQTDIQHKNFFGEIVICDRYVGLERTDKEWIESGYASPEAYDKSKNNGLLNDLYRQRGMCERD